MPLDRSCAPGSVERNIETEIQAGKTREQAVAIAMQIERDCKAAASDPQQVYKALAKAAGTTVQKARSREYLEAILEELRDKLPAWMVSMLHSLALPKAGGRARSRIRQLRAAAKVAANPSLRGRLSEEQRKAVDRELDTLGPSIKSDGHKPPKGVQQEAARGLELRREHGRGGTEVGIARARDLSNGRAVSRETIQRMVSFFARHEGNKDWGDDDEPSNGHIAWLLWGGDAGRRWAESVAEQIDKKSLSQGTVGPHAHGLDRLAGQTLEDGAHAHVFVVPDTGEVIYTMEDGEHAHPIGESGLDAAGGQHTHRVLWQGAELTTSIGGEHMHEVLLSSTGYGGAHTHELRLPNGTVLTSLTSAEAAEQFASVTQPMPPASVIAGALEEVHCLEARVAALEAADAALENALEDLAEGKQPELPVVAMEVVACGIDGTADVALLDDDLGVRATVPSGLDLLEGDVVDVSGGAIVQKSDRLFAMNCAEASKVVEVCQTIKRMRGMVEWSGPESNARAVFVVAVPNPLEAARKTGIVGADARVFEERYVAPLGLDREDVAVGFVCPHWLPDPVDTKKLAPWLKSLNQKLDQHPGAPVIALGKAAKEALGDRASVWVPHPAVVRKSGDTSQVDRKLRRVRLAAEPAARDNSNRQGESKPGVLADAEAGSGHKVVLKADRPEEQIVYGVVLDPNAIDAHDDWAPPLEIQRTAHDYLHKSRVVGLEHAKRVQARVVESFVEQYPTKADYEAAIAMRPHKVTRRPFGGDHLMSGAWVIGVKLEDREWAEYKAGRITGFSMGGFSRKTDITPEQMPKVEVIDLVPA